MNYTNIIYDQITYLIEQGDFFFILSCLIFFTMTLHTLIKTFKLKYHYSLYHRGFFEEIQTHLGESNVVAALTLCSAHKKSLLAQITEEIIHEPQKENIDLNFLLQYYQKNLRRHSYFIIAAPFFLLIYGAILSALTLFNHLKITPTLALSAKQKIYYASVMSSLSHFTWGLLTSLILLVCVLFYNYLLTKTERELVLYSGKIKKLFS